MNCQNWAFPKLTVEKLSEKLSRPGHTERGMRCEFALCCFELVFSFAMTTPVRIRVAIADRKKPQGDFASLSVWQGLQLEKAL